jgi:hypothetical protein
MKKQQRAECHCYSSEETKYLKRTVKGRSYLEINTLFNERFGLSMSISTLKGKIKRMGLVNGKRHNYTPDEILFLKRNFIECKFSELTKRFNKHFGLAFSEDRIKAFCHRLNLRNPKTGMQDMEIGAENFFNNKKFVKIRIRQKDERRLKTSETWKAIHILIWEKNHGPIPKGHVVIFADGNRLNYSLDNLLLISKAEFLMMNFFHLFSSNPELTKTGILLVRLKLLIAKRMRELKEKGTTA